jgi:hypothetical protein
MAVIWASGLDEGARSSSDAGGIRGGELVWKKMVDEVLTELELELAAHVPSKLLENWTNEETAIAE